MPRHTRSTRQVEGSQAGDSGQQGGQQTSGGAGSINVAGNGQQQRQTEILQALVEMMQAMQQQIQHVVPAQPAPRTPQNPLARPEPSVQPAPPQPWQGGGRSFAEFKSLAPGPFSGSTNPTDAEGWMREMEKAFMAHGSQEEERMRFATYLLQGEAYDWWLQMERGWNGQAVSWREFKEAFFNKYFPSSVQRQMETEFLELEQKNLSVAQYEAEFTRLARFAPEIVTTERAKITRFTEGLRPKLRQAVNAFELSTYCAVVSKALVIERDLSRNQKEWEQQKKRKGSPSGQSSGQAKKKDTYQTPSGPKGKETRCPNCGNFHPGRQCYGPKGACYGCGKMDHKVANCPFRRNQQPPPNMGINQQQQSRTQGRVFTLTQQDAAASNSVVAGTPVAYILL